MVGATCSSDSYAVAWRGHVAYRNALLMLAPGPKPHELYGKFTWKIENFSETSKRELRSNVFDVGNYKW